MSGKTPRQMTIQGTAHAEINGIGMGVLPDGAAYLTARGLARACGVAPSVIITWSAEYSPGSGKARDKYITQLLEESGYVDDNVFVSVAHDGTRESAFPEVVCMAVLDYYAFSALGPGEDD